MRFGCCLNMVAGDPAGVGADKLGALAASGFDYAELPLAEMMALPDEGFASLAREIEAAGIRCEACNNFFPKAMRLTGPGADPDAAFAYASAALRRAGSLGARCVVFGSGGAKSVPAGFPLAQGRAQVVELLRGIGPVARAQGIVVAIEPLRRAECNLVNSFAEACALAEDVGSAGVQVLVDFYHMREEGEPASSLEAAGRERLRHVHFACSRGRVYPRDIGEDDYAPFFAALRSIGYDARLSVEAYASDFALQAPAALRFLRRHLGR